MRINTITVANLMFRHNLLSMGFLYLLLSAVTIRAYAQEDKQVTNLKAIAIGYTSLQDTYLSPEKYHGFEARYLSQSLREQIDTLTPTGQSTSQPLRRIINEGVFSKTKNRTGNGSTLAGYYHFEYAMLWHCLSLNKLRICAGGEAELLGGFIYNTRNGNNPAQARALINIGGAVHSDYLINRKMSLSYDASLPLLGMTFSPNYGQSYYEIFDRGNYDHNIVPTTIASMPSLRHQIALTYQLRRFALTIGYLGDYRQQAVNNLKQHVYTHSVVLGITKRLTK